jgi:hypothetical protein
MRAPRLVARGIENLFSGHRERAYVKIMLHSGSGVIEFGNNMLNTCLQLRE